MRYLLDRNVCAEVLRGKSPDIEARLASELRDRVPVFVSSIVAFELWYGVAKSTRLAANTEQLSAFLTSWVSVLSFDQEDARAAGELRMQLESVGRPVGEYDLLIAGQGLRHRMTLVTANQREFGRIKNLVWEDWSS